MPHSGVLAKTHPEERSPSQIRQIRQSSEHTDGNPTLAPETTQSLNPAQIKVLKPILEDLSDARIEITSNGSISLKSPVSLDEFPDIIAKFRDSYAKSGGPLVAARLAVLQQSLTPLVAAEAQRLNKKIGKHTGYSNAPLLKNGTWDATQLSRLSELKRQEAIDLINTIISLLEKEQSIQSSSVEKSPPTIDYAWLIAELEFAKGFRFSESAE